MRRTDNPSVDAPPLAGRGGRLPLGRLGSFIVLQLFAAIAPLLVLPVVVRMVGTTGWVSLSIGYAVGAAAAIAVYCGWPIAGPPRVAGVSEPEMRAVVRESLVMRAMVAGPVLLIACAFTWALSEPEYAVLAILMALSIAASGFGASWCFIGLGKAQGIFRYDAMPKLVATVATIPCVAWAGSALWYPILLLVGTLVGVVASHRSLLGGRAAEVAQREPGFSGRLRQYLVLAMSGVVGAGYTSLAVPLSQSAGASLRSVADFAGALRLRSMAQNGIAAVTTAFQGWVAETQDNPTMLARMRTALLVNSGLGVLGGAGFAVLAPLVDGVFFGDAVRISVLLATINGATFTTYAVGASLTHHVLAPFGQAVAIGRTRITASIFGVPLLWLMAGRWGAEGAAGGVLLCELITLTLQARLALHGVRKRQPIQSSYSRATRSRQRTLRNSLGHSRR